FKILEEKVFAKDFIGKKTINPANNKQTPILSSGFVDEGIGTGIVMSVPAHAPWDFIALQNAKSSSNDSEIKKIELISLINTKDFGAFPAKEICEKMNIVSLAQKEELEKATEEVYKKEFHSGVLNESYGKFAGIKVSEAKDLLTKDFISKNFADKMLGFSEQVICRCGKEVIIQLVPNQWFIKYSDKTLTEKTKAHLKSMKVFPEQYFNELPAILDWFDDRACVRKGRWLGTRLPFDKEWIIEPISDSTLYPLTYTYSHFVNSKKLKLENLTEEFFDYIFLNKGTIASVSKKSKVNAKLLKQIKEEVDYWYPLDLNLGGKEHKTVHFPVFLFNHVGILP
ncbi:MAG: class I tRNA ligase family protein, partial [Candidatus Diapherotrites archaeon]|nr:class I tRNA ligase family protein [Candidatus Diapherotrites archaeon]